MWNDTAVTRMLSIQYPIIQAPMAGGPTTPELVAAVSNEGGLGFLGAGYMSPDSIRAAIRRIRELTDRPFGVNLFIPDQNIQVDKEVVKAMIHHLKSLEALPEEVRREIDSIPIENAPGDTFTEQLEVILEERIPVFSFTFGCPTQEQITELKSRGIRVIGTATSVAEAVYLQEAGVDAVVAQGCEAGGHRGTFLEAHSSSLIGTITLVPQIVDRVRIPVIASGGIMDGRGIAACLTLGASAIQMGTAFLASRESGAHPAHKKALLHSRDTETVITDAFSGKPARGLKNTFISWMEQYDVPIPPYPIQNGLTRPIRNWAARQADPEFMSLWAGQGSAQSRDASARDIVRQLIQEAERAIGKATGWTPNPS
ncbi:NAD(P)H-dependent flavin oxidoreductase [Kyrpidia spormannii]|uniref:Nitronate monooxygenase n=1 Tax=Kyrpidia spormannii TaxID=2055160 RepID=A0ACA8Z586_9BACL|nr:nitronate monooxygenase [Kyrpidia spormannii]CAB3389633.1 putative nitronate monooxygenase [Kyrpidia spormannii]